MAIIKNVDKLRIREIEENLANDKVLTIDSTGLVAWKNQDEITPDLSSYYTKSEIDALLENISYTGGDGIDITNNEIRIKQSVLDEINANTNKTLSDVTSEGNTTNVKMIGSEVFSNTMNEDYAQIKNVYDSGWGLLPLQSEMKIALTAKDGTTVLSSIDVSWLASGDLAVSIDDTDPENPELVFSQGGVEVARIPASTLLSGVVRGGDLSGYKLQFKDYGNTVLFDIDLEDLFDNYYTITEADGRFALRTRTITGTGSLTGGGDLTDDRTIDLTATAKGDIAKGVTAHGWGDFRDYGLGTEAVIKSGLLEDNNETGFYAFASSQQGFSFPRAIMLHRGGNNYGIIFSNSRDEVGFMTGDELIYTAWHSGNLTNVSQLNNDAGYITSVPDSFVTKDNISSSSLDTTIIDFDAPGNGASVLYAGFSSTNFPSGLSGSQNGGLLLRGNHSNVGEYQLFIARNDNDALLYRNQSGVWNRAASRDWVNNQGFVKDLSNYYTKNESNSRFVRTTGVQDIADTKTFLASPVVPNPTLDAHAVNKGWVEENFGVTKMIFDFDESMSSLAPLTNPTIELNTLNISIDGNGNILIPDTGIFEISVEVKNSSYPSSTGQGSFTISAQFEGKSSRVTMDQYIKYGGYSSFVAESDNQNGILTVLFNKTTPITNIQGTATVTIKKIK